MNTVDWVLAAYLGFGLLQGYRRGLLVMALMIAGYLVAWMVAQKEYINLANYLNSHFNLAGGLAHAMGALPSQSYLALNFSPMILSVTRGISFIGLIWVVETLISVFLVSTVAKIPLINSFFLNRWLGAVLGVVENLILEVILVTLLVPVISQLPPNPFFVMVEHSWMVTQLQAYFGPDVPTLTHLV